MTRTADVQQHSLRSLGAALRAGTATSAGITAAALDRVRALNDIVNAFVTIDEAGALEAARRADAELARGIDRGPLHGIPVGVKDLMDMAGLPTTCGSSSGFGVARAGADAEMITRLYRAGAVVVGKNTLHEFAYGATGDRSIHGASRNPADTTRMTGGSSGGSAAAVAAGMVPLALGTDTVGSVRVPAALCGVTGFKPAYDALPTRGVRPCAPSLDHVGLFTVDSADAALAYAALCDTVPDPSVATDPINVGWVSPGDLAPVDRRIVRATRALLHEAGLTPVSQVAIELGRSLLDTAMTIQRKEAFDVHRSHLEQDADLIDTEVLARLRSGRDVSTVEYTNATKARDAFRVRLAERLADRTVLALPSAAVTAPLLDERIVTIDEEPYEVRATLLGLTAPWNLAGVPAISVPAGRLDGLPIGIQLVAASGAESTLFAVASRLDAAVRARA